MNGKLRVAVVGCGTAGAASALFLARAGHTVTLYERVPAPGPVGAGIMMQPSGLLVLERLGLVERVLARGARVDRLFCETSGGRSLLDLRYDVLRAGLYGVGLHRGVLFETLFGALEASGVEARCGVSVVRVTRPRGGLVALVTESGETHGPYDLVVVSDGARSRVRDSMPFFTKNVTAYPWGALWFIGEDRSAAPSTRLHQVVRGAREMVGVLPTGIGPGNGDKALVSLFISVAIDAVHELAARGVGALKDRVLSLAPHAAPVLDQIDDFAQLTLATYWDVTMPRWHAPGVVLLGDAAHATSPQLGQGCNLALCDAAALSDAIAEEASVDAALERYTASRRDHLAYYQLVTRWLTPFFQGHSVFLGALRDVGMGALASLPFLGREMVRSMAGTKTGFLFGSLETRMPGDPVA
jgi:2-polyprenyl-6-methoxyphenol hydroxylase-like FAD-dependent oxidoreductase